jgi:hypothetical protein
MQSVVAFVAYLQLAGVSIPGFLCVLLLRRMRIDTMDERIADLLRSLDDHGDAAPPWTRVPRISTRRGLAYGVGGLAIVIGAQLVPVSADGRQATNVLRGIEQVMILGFFMLLRARRYFQVNADSLLAFDKRPPILFLRSFGDDERQQYASSRQAILDFSLETRLANHFHRFGPFIAIGSPKETVPQDAVGELGASPDRRERPRHQLDLDVPADQNLAALAPHARHRRTDRADPAGLPRYAVDRGVDGVQRLRGPARDAVPRRRLDADDQEPLAQS